MSFWSVLGDLLALRIISKCISRFRADSSGMDALDVYRRPVSSPMARYSQVMEDEAYRKRVAELQQNIEERKLKCLEAFRKCREKGLDDLTTEELEDEIESLTDSLEDWEGNAQVTAELHDQLSWLHALVRDRYASGDVPDRDDIDDDW